MKYSNVSKILAQKRRSTLKTLRTSYLQKVIGKSKRETGLVVPARFSAVTTELHIAEVSEGELSSKV